MCVCSNCLLRTTVGAAQCQHPPWFYLLFLWDTRSLCFFLFSLSCSQVQIGLAFAHLPACLPLFSLWNQISSWAERQWECRWAATGAVEYQSSDVTLNTRVAPFSWAHCHLQVLSTVSIANCSRHTLVDTFLFAARPLLTIVNAFASAVVCRKLTLDYFVVRS